MSEISVTVLGAEWRIVETTPKDEPRLVENLGFCDWTTRTIFVDKDAEGDLERIDVYKRKVIRHEIVHAFFHESGLNENSLCSNGVPWVRNEEMVDWFAYQGPKIYKAWQDVGALEE